MKSIIEQLPPKIAQLMHPDRRRNEEEYWSVRDQLLKQHLGQWIGFANGKVVAAGTSPVIVFHAAESTGLHPFFICVGREEEPCRIRRASFPYDSTYAGEPLPLIRAEFRRMSGSTGVVLDNVIPDTGADASILPWGDCQMLQLDPSSGVQGLLSGVAGGSSATLVFQIWAWIDGQEYPCRLQADFLGHERILGRDVMNRLEILFRGPVGEVVVNP